jgi:hypothetical protein
LSRVPLPFFALSFGIQPCSVLTRKFLRLSGLCFKIKAEM